MGTRSVTVFGATGTAGSAYVAALLDAGHEVRGTLRPGSDPQPLLDAGAIPAEVDLSHTRGAEAALDGADAVVIALLGRGDDPAADEAASTAAALAAAIHADVDRIVYTSTHLADAQTGVAHFDVKGRLEAEIVSSGLPYTVLRPTTFMDVLDTPWLRDAALRSGVLVSPIGLDVPISYVATADLAQLVVRALDDDRLDGAILPVGGPRPVTYRELLPLLEELAGRRVRYEQMDVSVLASQQPHLADMIRLFNAQGFVADPPPIIEEVGVQLTDAESFLRRSGWASAPPATDDEE